MAPSRPGGGGLLRALCLGLTWLLVTIAFGRPASSVAPLQAAEATTWQVGLAREPITPETSVWLAGYGSKRAPDGKIHELWMKAIALSDHM